MQQDRRMSAAKPRRRRDLRRLHSRRDRGGRSCGRVQKTEPALGGRGSVTRRGRRRCEGFQPYRRDLAQSISGRNSAQVMIDGADKQTSGWSFVTREVEEPVQGEKQMNAIFGSRVRPPARNRERASGEYRQGNAPVAGSAWAYRKA